MEYSKQPMNKWRKNDALPEEFSWENMKDGIATRMNRNKRKKRILFFICCFGIIGLISATLYYINDEPARSGSPEKKTAAIDYAIKNGKNEPNEDEHVEEYSDLSLSETKSKFLSKNNSARKPYAQTVVEKYNEKTVLASVNEEDGMKDPDGTIPKEMIVGFTIINPTATIEEISFSENSRDKRISLINHLKTHVYNVSESHPEDDLEPYFSPLQLEQHNNRKFDKHTSNTWKLDGGIAFWKTGQQTTFELTSAEHKASISERTLPGFSFSMQYNRQINNRFYASSGIDYQQLYSVFSYDGVKKSIINLDDIITKVEYNVLTGNETVTRGAAQVDQTIFRKLQNLNRISGFSIPVNIGYLYNYSKWLVQAEAGVTINVVSFGKGKTLYDGDIVAYNGKIPGLKPYPKIGLNGRFSVSYFLTPQLHAGMNIFINQYLANWTDDKALSLKPGIFGIGLGFVYTY
ncbi:MAG TPA: hypothetical protein DCX89_09020 [Saprospirales bacterium]|nr:hypothetical protein [Saprospirales bacterium]HRQ29193.1 hypothetical protein [Saprospiraceae bacterium]